MKGHIRQRSPGHFAIVIDINKDGARKRIWHSFKGTKREAQVECARLIAAMDEGSYVETNKTLTVGKLLLDRLAQWEAAKRITPKSAERYSELINNQITPHLGEKKLQSLKGQDIEQWHGTLVAAGLAPRTIGHSHRLLKKCLNEAVRFGLIVKNPAESEKPPQVEGDEVEIVGEGQLRHLLEGLRGHGVEPIAILALFAGLRRGEIFALRWRNVDLDKKVLRVVEALEQTKKLGVRFKAPKSRAGKRDVGLPDIVVDRLRQHRIRQLELRAKLGLGRLSDDDLLFPSLNGGPTGPRNFSAKTWPKFTASIGMPDIRFHALRHTHASQLIAAGVDVVMISKRLGHSNPSITLKVYAHLFANDDAKATAAINEALAKW
jgi:integrase